MGVDWKSTGIGAAVGGGSGLLVGGLAGGPIGAVAGLVGGAAIGGGVGALVGKKSPNPGAPLYIDGVEAPEDLYELLSQIYQNEELYQKYSREEALPPDFLLPREIMNYIIQRYAGGTCWSKYHSRGALLSIDSVSLLATKLPDYKITLKYLHALPLTLLAVEYILDNFASDEQLEEALTVLENKLGPVPEIYSEGTYRKLEYYIICAISYSIEQYQGPDTEITYDTVLNGILRNHHMDLEMYLTQMKDEMLIDDHMIQHYSLQDSEDSLYEQKTNLLQYFREKYPGRF